MKGKLPQSNNKRVKVTKNFTLKKLRLSYLKSFKVKGCYGKIYLKFTLKLLKVSSGKFCKSFGTTSLEFF